MLLSCPQREFSHLKLLLLLIFVLNFELQQNGVIYKEYFLRDLHFFARCFEKQAVDCQKFLQTITYDEDARVDNFLSSLPFSNHRAMNFLQIKNAKTKIIGKNLAKRANLKDLSAQLNVAALAEHFSDEARLDGFQYCPVFKTTSELRFVEHFRHLGHGGFDALTIWLYMLVNVQPVLLPYLETEGFPVPHTYATCGFSIFQAYGGQALAHFYDADFRLKLSIAKQLLEAAVRFSYGFHGFRLYITDLSADNIVYDRANDKLYFVDLDTVLIVDSEAVAATRPESTHKHERIECKGCFAYSQQDICAHRLSDINLYAACQLLREDLDEDRSEGFLQPWPTDILAAYPQLLPLLDLCVDCWGAECEQRFPAANKLIDLFEAIQNQNYA